MRDEIKFPILQDFKILKILARTNYQDIVRNLYCTSLQMDSKYIESGKIVTIFKKICLLLRWPSRGRQMVGTSALGYAGTVGYKRQVGYNCIQVPVSK